MGKKPAARQPSPMWVTTADLPTSAGHPFFERLNRVLEEAGFDAFVEGLCAVFYASRLGRPSLRPGRYFRLLFIGYFEGLSSERGIAWRVADSLSLRAFLDLDVTEAPPNHSTLSRTRRLIDVETHVAVFTWVLERLAGAGLVQGKTVGVDATTLEANAAMRSIERRDTGESYEAFVRQLAKASGIETPTRAELARFDRSRKDRKTSNKEWQSPQDPDAKIAKMKDGRTHLAHKAEHGIDLETGAILSVTVQEASEGDSATLPATLTMAAEQVEAVQPAGAEVEEVVADKGYHSDATLVALDEIGVRSYVSEPERGRRCWQDKKTGETPVGKRAAQKALYGNRRRIRGDRGRRLLRRRGELVERPFAHQYETGGLRRVWVRGHENVRKRVLIQAAGCNLGLLLRRLTGVGTPRSLQGRALSAICGLIALQRGPHNQLGFAYQVAFVRVLGRFPQQAPLEIDGEILRFAALQLGADAETIHAYAGRQQTVSEHQQRIGEYLRLRAFDAAAGERLARFLEDEALRLERTASLLARARAWLRDEHVLAPADSVLRRAIGAARHKARTLLTQRMAERLSAPMRDGLDALIAVDDDQPHSPLNRIKASSSSPSVGGMKRLLARLELIEATGVLGVDVGWVNGNYQRILFHSVRTASADRVRRMAAPRRHLALVCFLHQAWRDTLDQAVDMYGKLLDRNRKLVVQRYRRLGAVLLDPDVGDDELRVRATARVTGLRDPCAVGGTPDRAADDRPRGGLPSPVSSPTWRAGPGPGCGDSSSATRTARPTTCGASSPSSATAMAWSRASRVLATGTPAHLSPRPSRASPVATRPARYT